MIEDTNRVLIVDDEPQLCDILTEIAEAEGCTVDVAQGGLDALALLRERYYPAVLCDIMMPDITGLECFAKALSEGCLSPFVFVTAYNDFGRIVQAVRLGATDFISKPFDGNEVGQVVTRVLEMGKRRKSIYDEIKATSPALLEKVLGLERKISMLRAMNNIKRSN